MPHVISRPYGTAAAAIVLLLAVAGHPAWAQEKGTIQGRVTDKANGHAIAFASLAIPALKRGSLTDSEGQYSMTGVPVGTYELKIQYLGYKPDSRPSVVVTAGKPVVVNFQLEEIVVRQEKEVEVTAERRLVEARQGATMRSVGANEIRNLGVQTVGDVLQHQAGINIENDQIHVRGGRSDETVFVVNGVANRDLVTGESTAGALNARSVAEVNVATGAYDVRYGNALSGVVEVKLREGNDRFAGGLTTSAGSWGGRTFQGVVSGPDPLVGRLMHATGMKGSLTSILDVSGSLFETRFSSLNRASEGFFEGVGDNLAPPIVHQRLASSYEDSFLGYRFHYGDFFSPSEDNRWAARWGSTYKPNDRDKLSFNFSKRIAIDQGFSRTFINATGDAGDPAYPWQWAHRIDHAPTIFEDNVQTSLEWRRTLSALGFTEFQASRYYQAQRQDVQGKMWWQYVEPYDSSLPDSAKANDYFYDTGDDNTWQDRRSTSWALSGSVTQRIKRHEIELGFEHQFQDVQYVTIQDPWVYDPNGLGGSHDLWRVHPWVGDFYLRDRLEYEGFTADLGVRGDYWFTGREAERALADTANTNVTSTTRDAFYGDTRSFFGRRYKLKLSPRLIVAHPITEHSSFFFNYGEFTQWPSYRYVYSKLTSISSESFPLLGNPDLNPQVSINYELGAKHQFAQTAAVNATFFVKDVYDYPVATDFQRLQGASIVDFFVYLNGHFARAKGFELEVEKRRSTYWSGKVTYTYSQTKGKSSDPNAQRIVEEGGGNAAETPLAESFVSWNRPHKLSISFDARFDDAAPERWGFLKHSGLNLFVQGQSGRAYSPLSTTNAAGGAPYSGNAPVQFTTDMRINHYFRMGARKLDFSVTGQNIFNAHIINVVDPVTGQGLVYGVGRYDPRSFPDVNDYVRVSTVDNPSNYGPGAQWRAQMDYDF